jgi:hypothetical protein
MTEDRRTLADVEKERDRASKLFDQVAAERNELVRRVNELESTLRDVTGGDYDLGYSPADTIKELREELATAKAQRDEALKRAEVAELSRHNALRLCDERDEMLKRAEAKLTDLTTWKRGAPSEPGWYATRIVGFLRYEVTEWLGPDDSSGMRRRWAGSIRQELIEHLPIRLDKCAEPAPPSPYASEHKPEDTEDA